MNADGDVVNVTEANTRESSNGKIPEGLPGSERVGCVESDARNLGVSCYSFAKVKVGLSNRTRGRPM